MFKTPYFLIECWPDDVLQASASPTSRHRAPISPYDHDSYKSFRPLDVTVRHGDVKSPVVASPSMEYPRKNWWDNLLDTYSSTRDDS